MGSIDWQTRLGDAKDERFDVNDIWDLCMRVWSTLFNGRKEWKGVLEIAECTRAIAKMCYC